LPYSPNPGPAAELAGETGPARRNRGFFAIFPQSVKMTNPPCFVSFKTFFLKKKYFFLAPDSHRFLNSLYYKELGFSPIFTLFKKTVKNIDISR
jgi:hypothetical protein